MIYGHDKTIHGTKHLHVEVDRDGNVAAVWFRCMLLPFEQVNVEEDRASEMDVAYEEGNVKSLVAVEVEEPSRGKYFKVEDEPSN